MKKIRVTDHALIRFIERFVGLDVEAMRDFIEAEVRQSVEAGASKLHREHITYVIENNENAAAIVTILPRSKSHA